MPYNDGLARSRGSEIESREHEPLITAKRCVLVDTDGIGVDVISVNQHTNNQEVRVYQDNHVCANNTTTTPLLANATFSGDWQDCLNYQEVNVSIVASHNSAVNGLVFSWSADGVNVGDTDVFSYYASSGGANYTQNPAFRYFKLSYTNGGTNQASFSLQTILRKQMTGGSFHRIDSTLKDDSDGRLNISIPKLKTAANTYVSQTATASGNAKISLEELESGISVNNKTQLKTTQYTSSGQEILFATSTLQETLNSMIETLQELSQRLAPLAGAMNNTAQLRVMQTSVPSTAVTGPLTNAQYIVTPVQGGVHYTQKTANENLAAIISNINNTSITG